MSDCVWECGSEREGFQRVIPASEQQQNGCASEDGLLL